MGPRLDDLGSDTMAGSVVDRFPTNDGSDRAWTLPEF
jgi:hypothetical protein